MVHIDYSDSNEAWNHGKLLCHARVTSETAVKQTAEGPESRRQ